MTTGAAALRFRVEGMDCPACAQKIETAVGRVPGVGSVAVSYAAGMLDLKAANAGAAAPEVVRRLGALGYQAAAVVEHEPTATSAQSHHDQGSPSAAGAGWYATGKGRLVLLLGALLGMAFVADALLPVLGRWPYVAVAMAGLFTVLPRAVVLARNGSPFSIETLMVVATMGALAIDASAEAAVVIFLFAVGELLEGVAAGRARAGITALTVLMPRTALVEIEGEVREVPVASLRPNQIVQVRPGDRVPADGLVLEGVSAVDEAPLTGEAVPVAKEPGAMVFAGTIVADGRLRVRVEKVGADNTAARILKLVEEAQASRAPTQRFIERFSAWYTPGAMLASALVVLIPPLAFGADWHTWIYRGLSLLLIACPCALVLSTPAAIAAGIARGARLGLLLKSGAALETIGKVVTVAFDKTGTLTLGRPRVIELVPLTGDEEGLLTAAAAVEQGSSHPLAQAILRRAVEAGIAIPPVTDAAAVPGKTVQGLVAGVLVEIGSPRWAAERGAIDPALAERIVPLESAGQTVAVVVADGRVLGLIGLRDEPRADAAEAIATLRGSGVRCVMLTGDNHRAAKAIGDTLGLEVQAELLPDAKLAAISALRQDGPVAMVGDGINDAPALAAASIGIAMGGGTEATLETADAALLKSRVGGVAELVELSRATLTNIRQNVTVALGLKAVFLVTSLLGITTLWMAILADTGATVLVTLNALRLLRFTGRGESSRL